MKVHLRESVELVPGQREKTQQKEKWVKTKNLGIQDQFIANSPQKFYKVFLTESNIISKRTSSLSVIKIFLSQKRKVFLLLHQSYFY